MLSFSRVFSDLPLFFRKGHGWPSLEQEARFDVPALFLRLGRMEVFLFVGLFLNPPIF